MLIFCRSIPCPTLAASLEPLDLHRNSQLLSFFLSLHKKWSFPWRISSVNKTKSVVSCGFGINLKDVHLNWLNWFHFLVLVWYSLVLLMGWMFISVNVTRCYKYAYLGSFFLRTAGPWNSLPVESFILTCDLSGVNRHLFSLDSF